MTNLTNNSFLCIYFSPLRVSSNPVLIIRRINCINTISGICHPVSATVSCGGRIGTLSFRPFIIRRINFINTTSGICHSVSWPFRVQVGKERFPFRPAHEMVTDIELHIPEVVFIQFILLMMSTGLLETCGENWNKYIEKNCASCWSFPKK